MDEVHARLLAPGEPDDVLAVGGGEAAAGGPAPITVYQGAAALLAEPREQPPDVPLTQVQTGPRLGPGDAPLHRHAERVLPMQLPLSHGD